jgi:hypothetical protein
MRMIQRLLPVPLLLLACAPNSEIPRAQTDRSIVTVQTTAGAAGQALELTREANIQSVALQGDVAEAWAALPPVFEALDLPITGADSNAKLLSTVQRIRRIGGKSPASYFQCPGPYGNLASSGDVYVSIRAQILPGEGGSGSVLRTVVDANARSSTSGSHVQCSSNGSLQKLIAESLVARLANL